MQTSVNCFCFLLFEVTFQVNQGRGGCESLSKELHNIAVLSLICCNTLPLTDCPFISWIPYEIRAYSHSNHRALQSKSTTVGDYRRRPEPDRQKARCRAGTVRGRRTSSATEQVSADENLRRFIPSKNPLPSRSSLH